jgi:tetraprenyl-beta-curcumene synthase
VLALRVALALLVTNVRYWLSVAPEVRSELRRWKIRAATIPDASLRELATLKLNTEHFNAEVAATLATLAPRARRKSVVEAIVALEVIYDYLDGMTEQPTDAPLQSGAGLYAAFTDALGSGPPANANYYEHHAHREDGGYLRELSSAVSDVLASLPARGSVETAVAQAAARCAEGQIRVHAAGQLGIPQLEQWAQASARDADVPWREYLAGAVASVLSVHALIATAASESVTPEQAHAIDAAYLSICALSTMLDSLVDYERDVAGGDPWLVGLYGDPRRLGASLTAVAERALAQAWAIPRGAEHLVRLVGVVAYYTSAPEARSGAAAVEIARLQRDLGAMLTPTSAVMRAWRLAKRVRSRLRAVRGADG